MVRGEQSFSTLGKKALVMDSSVSLSAPPLETRRPMVQAPRYVHSAFTSYASSGEMHRPLTVGLNGGF